MKTHQKGFTLMEMIGVVAVIAILASMATPMIFEAIRNAKVAAFVEDVNVVRTAVARYYEDTGDFPYHRNNVTTDGERMLISNNTSSPVSGWDGPYIEKELVNPFSPGSEVRVNDYTGTAWQFDLDGDGTVDTNGVAVIYITTVNDTNARKISDIFDGDGDVVTGDGAWDAAGRVKRYGTGDDFIIYLTRI